LERRRWWRDGNGGEEEGYQEDEEDHQEAETHYQRARLSDRQEDLLAPLELSSESSVTYLLDHGLLSVAAAVEHGLDVEEVSGRNRNFIVRCGPQRGYFVKQAPPAEIGTAGRLSVEAALYQWFAAAPAAERLRARCPRRLHFDPTRSILILDLVDYGVTFHEVADDASSPTLTSLYGLAAVALAECHRIPVREPATDWLPRSAPWILDVARPSPASLRELAPAQLRLIEALQSQPDAVAGLDRLRGEWRPTHLIHGDFKWNNVLVVRNAAGAPDRVLLLDWEMAQLGDPAWDVGAGLHALLADAVLGLTITDGVAPEAAAQLLGAALPALHAAHRDFWEGYLGAARLSGSEASAMLRRLPDHVAARLIKTAYEWSQAEAHMPRRAAAVLQLGINMLLRSDQAGALVLDTWISAAG